MRAERMEKSKSARIRRRELKKVIEDRTARLYSKLRKLRKSK